MEQGKRIVSKVHSQLVDVHIDVSWKHEVVFRVFGNTLTDIMDILGDFRDWEFWRLYEDIKV